MKIVFMGTPDFAVPSLQHLIQEGHDICGVFTQPDKPRNRGMKVVFSPVKEYAISQSLAVYQPLTLRDGEALRILQGLAPELIVVAAYGKILPNEILTLPKYGCINVHSSILPKYRGAAPINWAIINGELTTGVTIMYMDQGLDCGDIIQTVETPIGPQEDAGMLTERLAYLGAEALGQAVSSILSGTVTRKKQDDAASTYAPMLDRTLSPIDWTQSAKNIHNKIRGLIPWPCATTVINGKNVKIYQAEIGEATTQIPGTMRSSKQGIEVSCGDHITLVITQLQPEGGKRMMAVDYLRGHPLQI